MLLSQWLWITIKKLNIFVCDTPDTFEGFYKDENSKKKTIKTRALKKAYKEICNKINNKKL